MSSYYALLFLVDVELSDDLDVENEEIIEFSWVAYDVEQQCATEQARYCIRPEYSEVSDAKLQLLGIDPNINSIQNGLSLADAVQQLDSVIFSACQKSRKPMCLASFNVSKVYKALNNDAAKKEVTLYPHYEHLIDVARLIQECESTISDEDLKSIRQTAHKMGLNPVGHRESGLDNCQMASHILSRLFQKGLHISKDHRKYITDGGPVAQMARPSHSATLIRLRGLPWEVDESQVVLFLSPVCRINQDCVNLVIGPDARSTGEAYVAMPNIEARDAAIKELHGKMIGKRWVEVFKATVEDFERYKASRRGFFGNGTVEEGILRLRGLPWSCNEYEIVKFFRAGGYDITVDEIVMGYASDNRLTGEAWVMLSTVEEAEMARSALHKKAIGRRYIEIFTSSREEMEQAKNYRTAQVPKYPKYAAKASYGFTVIRLRGLPFNSNVSHIMEFFAGMKMLAVVPVSTPYNGKPSGEAYVQFSDAEEAWRAYAMKSGHLIERRYIELFPSSLSEMEKAVHTTDNPRKADMSQFI